MKESSFRIGAMAITCLATLLFSSQAFANPSENETPAHITTNDILGPTEICVGQIYSFDVLPVPGAVYVWTAVGGQVLSGQGTTHITASWDTELGNILLLDIVLLNSTVSDTSFLTTYTRPNINLGPNGAYCGQNLVLNPGPGFQSYLWQNGSTIDSFPVNGPGSYWVKVTDNNGCYTYDTVNIAASVATPSIYPGDVEICEGSSTMLFGPNGYATYLWNGMNIGQAVTINQAMNLTLTVIDSLGCYAHSLPAVISVHPLPVPVIDYTLDTLRATPFETCTGCNFEWYMDGNMVGINSPWHFPDSSGGFKVVVQDSNGCFGQSADLFVNTVSIDPAQQGTLTVWPNPAQQDLNIEIPADLSLSAQMRMYAPNGQILFQTLLSGFGTKFHLNTREFPAGLYMLEISDENQTLTSRIIITE